MDTTKNTEEVLTAEELKLRVDELMEEATRLQNAGRWAEADTVIAEAENLEDRNQ